MAYILFLLWTRLDRHYGTLIPETLTVKNVVDDGIKSEDTPKEDMSLAKIINFMITKDDTKKMHNKYIHTQAICVSDSNTIAADSSHLF